MPRPTVLPHAHCHDVLVVDDFDATREAIVSMLQTHGFTARGAASGPDALDMLQAGVRPCMVILDVRMPRMSGWETWERMKAHADIAKTPIVILSADPADHARASAAGIREFLRKPIDGSHLIDVVDRYCARRSNPEPGRRRGSAHVDSGHSGDSA
jgi:CheY-like chemotaxis protein